MAVINFGSINIDHIYTVPHFVKPGETLSSSAYQCVLGGKGANQSIACAKANIEVKHVGGVNTSDAGFVAILKDAGVNTTLIQEHTSTATGHAIIQVNSEGENAIVLFAGANHALSDSQIDNALNNANKYDWVLMQNETNAVGKIIEKASMLGLPIAFNPAPMTHDVAKLPLGKVTLLFVNEVEAMQLTDTTCVDEASRVLSINYPDTKVILTLGKAGVKYMYKGDEISVPGFVVNAVDTTAAGDTFTGFFLATYIAQLAGNSNAVLENASNETSYTKNEHEKALTFACAAAALCVTKSGAAPSIPTANDVESFMAQFSQ